MVKSKIIMSGLMTIHKGVVANTNLKVIKYKGEKMSNKILMSGTITIHKGVIANTNLKLRKDMTFTVTAELTNKNFVCFSHDDTDFMAYGFYNDINLFLKDLYIGLEEQSRKYRSLLHEHKQQ